MRAEEFDWSQTAVPTGLELALVDETLRDGMQSPSVVHPSVEDKLTIVELMIELGIQHANIGLPGSSQRAFDDACALGRALVATRRPIALQCAARTHPADVRAGLDLAQAVGSPVELMTFIGGSPLRLRAEGWDLDFVLQRSREALSAVTRAGLPASFVVEDATRTPPALLEPILRNAIDEGASRLVLCDTVGWAIPSGVARLVAFVRKVADDQGLREIGIDFHGHNDRGLALANSLAAIDAGATRVHGCALGIGERAGNTSMDQLIANLFLLGKWSSIGPLLRYVTRVAEACEIPIPSNLPVVGGDSFRTMSGVHAAAILKARRMGDSWLADRVYACIPAADLGRTIELEVGPMSGASSVQAQLERLRIADDGSIGARVLAAARAHGRPLTVDQIARCAEDKTGS